jgi:pyruvate dehydrogenase E2 component (dihydrolipoamide acetyltransferase)
MKYFKLPDLGEGLMEAEVCEWAVKEGDSVTTDQLLVSVETAKAIVEIPSPCDGVIAHLFGRPGDLIHTGEPLVEFVGEDEDTGTVVGNLQAAPQLSVSGTSALSGTSQAPLSQSGLSDSGLDELQRGFVVGAVLPGANHASHHQLHNKATPAVRSLADRLDVDIDSLTGSGAQGLVTMADVEHAAQLDRDRGGAVVLRGVRRAMAKNMIKANQQVCQVTVIEDVDVNRWPKGSDVSMRLVKAIRRACEAEPLMNSWFDGESLSLRTQEKIDLGIAVDTADGLFVPVLRDIGQRSIKELRRGLDKMREDVRSRTIPPQELTGATITLSNFGTIAGRYATTVVVPPMVCIVGAGKIRDTVVAHKGKACVRKVLPLSLSFDHRCITGGEATRFLHAMIKSLSKK